MVTDSLLLIILLALAVWRVSNLIVNERGPYAIFEKFREHLYTSIPVYRGDEKIGEQLQPISEIAQLFSCVWCSSVWFSLAATAFYIIMYGFDVWVVILPFSISALAILLDRIIVE